MARGTHPHDLDSLHIELDGTKLGTVECFNVLDAEKLRSFDNEERAAAKLHGKEVSTRIESLLSTAAPNVTAFIVSGAEVSEAWTAFKVAQESFVKPLVQGKDSQWLSSIPIHTTTATLRLKSSGADKGHTIAAKVASKANRVTSAAPGKANGSSAAVPVRCYLH
jgi:hypothetical protein